MFPEVGQKYCLYKCKKCGVEFEAMHYKEYRLATGHSVEHCEQEVRILKTYTMAFDGPVEMM